MIGESIANLSLRRPRGSDVAKLARKLLNLPTAAERTAQLLTDPDCRVALDVGCGGASNLTALRPRIMTVGVDGHAPALALSRSRDAHDHYVHADILKSNLTELTERAGVEKFDLVTLIGVIEHVPKRIGFKLLERCEELSCKYVLVETPNGFVPQGPEFGNEFQRHLSGWFQHDFEGSGYDVYGTTGTKYLRGYGAQKKWDLPGVITLDFLLARALFAHRWPRHAFNLIAIKDVRGVAARLPWNGNVA